MGILGKAQAASQVMEQLAQMARAVLIVERNTGQLWKKVISPEVHLTSK